MKDDVTNDELWQIVLSENADRPFLWQIVNEHGVEATLDNLESVLAALVAADAPSHTRQYFDQVRTLAINHVRALRLALAQGDMKLVVIAALGLGQLDMHYFMHDLWMSGAAVRVGGIKGAKRRGPTNYDELRRVYKEVRPRCANDAASHRAVAKQCGVKARKVRRAVTGH
jgi:hypothetical protein